MQFASPNFRYFHSAIHLVCVLSTVHPKRCNFVLTQEASYLVGKKFFYLYAQAVFLSKQVNYQHRFKGMLALYMKTPYYTLYSYFVY